MSRFLSALSLAARGVLPLRQAYRWNCRHRGGYVQSGAASYASAAAAGLRFGCRSALLLALQVLVRAQCLAPPPAPLLAASPSCT